jgi:hypothetical protein
MALFADCIACAAGEHQFHNPVPGPVPKGMIGGHVCPCEGDCAARNPQKPLEFIKGDDCDWPGFDEAIRLLASAGEAA